MINLNKKWVDGQTYKQIFDEALKRGLDENYINHLLATNIRKAITASSGRSDVILGHEIFEQVFNEEDLKEFSWNKEVMDFRHQFTRNRQYIPRPHQLDILEKIFTREFLEVRATVITVEMITRAAKVFETGDYSDAISSIDFYPFMIENSSLSNSELKRYIQERSM